MIEVIHFARSIIKCSMLWIVGTVFLAKQRIESIDQGIELIETETFPNTVGKESSRK